MIKGHIITVNGNNHVLYLFERVLNLPVYRTKDFLMFEIYPYNPDLQNRITGSNEIEYYQSLKKEFPFFFRVVESSFTVFELSIVFDDLLLIKYKPSS